MAQLRLSEVVYCMCKVTSIVLNKGMKLTELSVVNMTHGDKNQHSTNVNCFEADKYSKRE